MKLYSENEKASMAMAVDPVLRQLLQQVIRDERIESVVETGTYLGLGSTTLVAQAFAPDSPPRSFVTIEANYSSWMEARKNLARLSFVKPLWGLSVRLDEAQAFLAADECLRDHSRWPEIFIDDDRDPLSFYSAEVRGQLGGIANAADASKYEGEDLLRRELRAASGRRLLVVLDSAGGTGFLEFSILQAECANRPFVLMLDDVHHLKHFRSLLAVRSDPRFTELGSDIENGWLLTRCSP